MPTTKIHHTPLQTVCNLIPPYLTMKLARKHGVDKHSRSFSEWSHVVALLYAQLAHSLSLNDVADGLRNHRGALHSIRRATPPSRNGLAHATKVRSADMAEDLFWSVLKHLQEKEATFGFKHRYSKLPRRFRRNIYAVDSTTISLVANCMDWAKHRRRKAAAKVHMNLDLNRFLPAFAIVKAASSADATEARELCAHLKDGEIALFDKAYVDFEHLFHLNERGVQWVTRSKGNMAYEVMGQHTESKGNIISDELILLVASKSQKNYPDQLRLVTGEIEVDGKKKVMCFLTNNLSWSANSIAELYRARWAIEVFFKQIKQTLQLSSFLGHSENALKWQVWMSMLAYILLRFIGFIGSWNGSFRRLYCLVRGVIFSRRNIYLVMENCGTASSRAPPKKTIEQQVLPGMEGFSS
jgi:hypothetical protein